MTFVPRAKCHNIGEVVYHEENGAQYDDVHFRRYVYFEILSIFGD